MSEVSWTDLPLEEVRAAAEKGDVEAQCALGQWIAVEDAAAAAGWYRKAAEQGNAAAQTLLGKCFYDGEGVEKDFAEAVNWYRKAADKGDAAAQKCLGSCFERGQGVEQDDEEAVKWYRKAAEQGDAAAQKCLGSCFDLGQGVEQDYEEAVKWYRKAAEQGDAWAQDALGECFANGDGVDQDYEEAVSWYRKAAEQGDLYAQVRLGDCLFNGEGVEEDRTEAVDWYHMAAAQGNAEAQFRLGKSFYEGEGVGQDVVEAASWLHEAAEHGSSEACQLYGEMLSVDDGVLCNCDEALKWLRRCPNSLEAQTLISQIEERATVIKWNGHKSRTSFERLVRYIRSGDSIFGTTDEGNTLLHEAAATLALEHVALLFEHPLFDELVVRANDHGRRAYQIVGDACSAQHRANSTSRAIASVLSCRRSTRAACFLWCLEKVASVPTLNRCMSLPHDIGKLIVRFVASPHAVQFMPAGSLRLLPCDPAQLVRFVNSSWRHAPTSVGNVLRRDRLAVARSEASASAHLVWLREEARSLRDEVISATTRLAELFRDGVTPEMLAEQQQIDDMRVKLLSVTDARRSLLWRLGEEAFKAELALLETEAADVEKRIVVAQRTMNEHVDRQEFVLAAASKDAVASLEQRLAEVHNETSDIRMQLATTDVGAPPSDESAGPSDRGSKRSADVLDHLESNAVAQQSESTGEPDSKRAKNITG
jgi:TPR repeat protein